MHNCVILTIMQEGSSIEKPDRSTKEQKDGYLIPPYDAYWKLLLLDPDEGIPSVEKLPDHFRLPEEFRQYFKEIDSRTTVNIKEAYGFVDVTTNGYRMGKICKGFENVIITPEPLLRTLGGEIQLFYLFMVIHVNIQLFLLKT